jgi:hypothetical protein
MPKQSPLDHLVRVTYRLFPGDPEASFVGTVVDERAPGRGPTPGKPGKRFWVAAREATGLSGWYSDREFEVIGFDAARLPAAEYLMLDSLCSWAALGYQHRHFPARLARVARALEARGLAVVKAKPSPGQVLVAITSAGQRTSTEVFCPVPTAPASKSARAL